MRYLTIFKEVEKPDGNISQEQMVAMGKLIEEMARAGVLITTEGCHDSSSGVRVRRTGGKMTVTDGPFTEAKEVIGGFALLKVDSLKDAIAWTKRFAEVAGDGELEIRQLYDSPAYPPA